MAQALVRNVAAEESLLSRLENGEPFSQAQLLDLLRQLADDLAGVHRKGEIHGTITPSDILFDEAGEASLTGFGRDTTPDPVREKPYAPVELYAPVHDQGPWTDVYSLGALLWHAVMGGPPPEVLLRKGDATLEALAPAGFDPAFLRAIDAALEIAPQRRPQTLDSWLAMFPMPAATPASRLPVEPDAPAFPLWFEERLFVPAQPQRRRGPLFTIAALNGVAAYLRQPFKPTSEAPAVAPPVQPITALTAPPAEAEGTLRRMPAARWPLMVAASVLAVWAATVLLTPDVEMPPELASEPLVVAPPVIEAMPVPSTSTPAPPISPPILQSDVGALQTAAPAPAPPVATKAPPPERRAAAASQPAPPSAAKPEPRTPEPRPPVVEEPAPSLEGATPRALLSRADRTLRGLFGDYERLRSAIKRSYNDEDIRQSIKERAYRESLRIHDDLLALRNQRNRLARTGSARTANKRYDAFDASAARIDARMAEVRRTL